MSPASTRPLPFTSAGVPAVLSRVIVASVDVGVDVLDGIEVTVPPPGFVPFAVAVLSTEPASTSAWVIV